jgi:nucleotide-binding universal stress UspA family protein
MQNILVAIDGSAHSQKIVDFACDIAKKVSAAITLIYVIKNPAEESEGIKEYEKAEGFPDAYAEYLKEVGDSVMSKWTKEVQDAGVSCKPLVEYGNPADRILETAKANNVDMTIVGLHGLHGLARLRSLGSVSRRIVENASCPVVVVP